MCSIAGKPWRNVWRNSHSLDSDKGAYWGKCTQWKLKHSIFIEDLRLSTLYLYLFTSHAWWRSLSSLERRGRKLIWPLISWFELVGIAFGIQYGPLKCSQSHFCTEDNSTYRPSETTSTSISNGNYPYRSCTPYSVVFHFLTPLNNKSHTVYVLWAHQRYSDGTWLVPQSHRCCWTLWYPA